MCQRRVGEFKSLGPESFLQFLRSSARHASCPSRRAEISWFLKPGFEEHGTCTCRLPHRTPTRSFPHRGYCRVILSTSLATQHRIDHLRSVYHRRDLAPPAPPAQILASPALLAWSLIPCTLRSPSGMSSSLALKPSLRLLPLCLAPRIDFSVTSPCLAPGTGQNDPVCSCSSSQPMRVRLSYGSVVVVPWGCCSLRELPSCCIGESKSLLLILVASPCCHYPHALVLVLNKRVKKESTMVTLHLETVIR